MRGLIRPAGRRGSTDLYRVADLDCYVMGDSGSLPDGRTVTPGKEQDGDLAGRLEADRVSGYLAEGWGVPRSRSRDVPQDRDAKGGEPHLRKHQCQGRSNKATGAPKRNP